MNKTDAERLVGEMLAELLPHGGGRPKTVTCEYSLEELSQASTVTLSDFNISRNQSSKWSL